jgi:hypothetical protein
MADNIREWFEAHEDGELMVSERGAPWRVIFPSVLSQVVIYTTKFQAVGEAVCQCSMEPPVGLLARYGLPREDEVQALKQFVGERRLLYIGDADPCDLLIFAWLSTRLTISYRGLSDTLLEKCAVSLNKSIMIGQSADEVASHALLDQQLPDWRELVGPRLAEILAAGKKVEAEVLVTCRKVTNVPFDFKALFD